MFFITPDHAEHSDGSHNDTGLPIDSIKTPTEKRKRLPFEPDDPAGHHAKRTTRACDRCRVRKTKCTGGKLCERCKRDNAVCVISQESKRSSLPSDPAYTHLVESQRDRLAQALSDLLNNQTDVELTRLRGLLADMGIPTGNTMEPVLDSDHCHNDDLPQSANPILDEWASIFDGLDDAQIQAIESYVLPSPQIQSGTSVQNSHIALPNTPLSRSDAHVSRKQDSSRETNVWDDAAAGAEQHFDLYQDLGTLDGYTTVCFEDWAHDLGLEGRAGLDSKMQQDLSS